MNTDIVVIGGGISGLTSAIEAAETGYNVILIEKNPYLGGRVVQLNKYFPKLCPPYCGFEILIKRLKNLNNLKYITNANVKKVVHINGNYTVDVSILPRFVNDLCTSCGKCVDVCPVSRENDFNFGMNTTKAIYFPHALAFPALYVIDPKYCLGKECAKCVNACQYNAIDLAMKEEKIQINAKSVIVATGWDPYDAKKLAHLGYGKYQNVITNIMFERIASPDGPTKGKIMRISDNKEPKNIAIVQCAGSRDENYLPYCSQICCLASMKHAFYIKEQIADANITIFYIDLRAYGLYEHFLEKLQTDKNVTFTRGKVAKIEETPSKNLIVHVEDTASGIKIKKEFDLVILATGMQPSTVSNKIDGLKCDNFGFVIEDDIFNVAGVAKKPSDVSSSIQDATAAVLGAIQHLRKGE
ncbi:MAG: CoB--CoM heterodisulfide reductase iron-sulfur subunit A family protein [Candidatus Micrarchaeaceae archaeon]